MGGMGGQAGSDCRAGNAGTGVGQGATGPDVPGENVGNDGAVGQVALVETMPQQTPWKQGVVWGTVLVCLEQLGSLSQQLDRVRSGVCQCAIVSMLQCCIVSMWVSRPTFFFFFIFFLEYDNGMKGEKKE